MDVANFQMGLRGPYGGHGAGGRQGVREEKRRMVLVLGCPEARGVAGERRGGMAVSDASRLETPRLTVLA